MALSQRADTQAVLGEPTVLPGDQPAPGRVIEGRYELLDLVGAGSGGDVWRARHVALDRVVAVKMLIPTEADSVDRFQREATLAARLDHPNIVATTDYGIDHHSGRPFLVMSFVDGPTAADLVGDFGADPGRVVEIVTAVAAALDHAHGRSGDAVGKTAIVHRDVKPGNILIGATTGRVYLADFGVARLVSPAVEMTLVPSVIGTPGYIAPELWRSAPATPACDVYSLAVTAFRLLTGMLPNAGDLAPAAAPPAASSVRPGLPAAVDAVLATGMAARPADRQPSAGEFAAAVRAALTPAPPVPVTGAPVSPPVNPPQQPASSGLTAYLGSGPHFTGLALAGIVIVLWTAGVLPGGWLPLVVALLGYTAGALGGRALAPRPVPGTGPAGPPPS